MKNSCAFRNPRYVVRIEHWKCRILVDEDLDTQHWLSILHLRKHRAWTSVYSFGRAANLVRYVRMNLYLGAQNRFVLHFPAVAPGLLNFVLPHSRYAFFAVFRSVVWAYKTHKHCFLVVIIVVHSNCLGAKHVYVVNGKHAVVTARSLWVHL